MVKQDGKVDSCSPIQSFEDRFRRNAAFPLFRALRDLCGKTFIIPA